MKTFRYTNLDISKVIEESIENPSKVYNITHIADFDGIGSASIIRHYFKIPIQNILFCDYTPEKIKEVLDIVKSDNKSKTIILSDLGIDEKTIPLFTDLINHLKATNSKIIWLDHHNWTDKAINDIGRRCDYIIGGDNGKYCGAELVYQNLIISYFKDTNLGEKLSNIAHKTDFNLPNKGETINNLIEAITYINNHHLNDLSKLVEVISEGNIDSDRIKDYANQYIIEEKDSIITLKKNIFKKQLSNKIIVGVGFANFIESNKAASIIKDTTNCDISIFIGPKENKISIRSNDKVNSIEIASILGGNGHERAAGASVDKKVKLNIKNPKSIHSYANYILKLSEKIYENKRVTKNEKSKSI